MAKGICVKKKKKKKLVYTITSFDTLTQLFPAFKGSVVCIQSGECLRRWLFLKCPMRSLESVVHPGSHNAVADRRFPSSRFKML